MSFEKKENHNILVGVFIQNSKGELLLAKVPEFDNKYYCLYFITESGEFIKELIKKNLKDNYKIKTEKIEFINFSEDLNFSIDNDTKGHFIFLDYLVKVEDFKTIKGLKVKHKWQKLEDWLKNKNLSTCLVDTINKIKNLPDKDYAEKYKRALADYQNLVKRTADEKLEFVKYANKELIHEILPIYDNLKMSLEHVDEAAQGNGWAEGIKYVVKQFKDTLRNLGVEEIKTSGKKFDPELMEAMEGKGERVKKEVKAGYTLNGKVIMPAKVILK